MFQNGGQLTDFHFSKTVLSDQNFLKASPPKISNKFSQK